MEWYAPLFSGSPSLESGLVNRHGILIIEDDLYLRGIMEDVAKTIAPGRRVDWAISADEVKEAISKGKFSLDQMYDLVISDILLPGTLSGLDLFEFCRVDKFCNLPFLFMSGLGPEEYLKTTAEIGGRVRFLAKPFTRLECTDAIAGLMKYSHSNFGT